MPIACKGRRGPACQRRMLRAGARAPRPLWVWSQPRPGHRPSVAWRQAVGFLSGGDAPPGPPQTSDLCSLGASIATTPESWKEGEDQASGTAPAAWSLRPVCFWKFLCPSLCQSFSPVFGGWWSQPVGAGVLGVWWSGAPGGRAVEGKGLPPPAPCLLSAQFIAPGRRVGPRSVGTRPRRGAPRGLSAAPLLPRAAGGLARPLRWAALGAGDTGQLWQSPRWETGWRKNPS